MTRHKVALAAGFVTACVVVAVAFCAVLAMNIGGASTSGQDNGAVVADSGSAWGDGVAESGPGPANAPAPDAPAASKPALTPSGQAVPEEMIPEVVAEHEDGVVLVSLARGYTPDELSAAINASGCTIAQDITEEDVDAGFVTLEVADGYDVAHAMTQLEMLPETEAAQPNFIYRIASDDDAQGAAALSRELVDFSLTASSDNAGASLLAQATEINDPSASLQWSLSSINAYEAWDTIKVNKRVAVAVLDNGCLTTHEDLKDNIVATFSAVNKSTDVTPVNDHGTHVAGIVAATANNGKGVAGVSYNAGLVPIKVFQGVTTYTSYLMTAYKYIEDNASAYNIKVVNVSLGGGVSGTSASEDRLGTADKAFIKVVDNAYDAGILTVCSSGNEALGNGGAYLNYPSDWLGNALSVISLENGTPPRRTSKSNYNMAGQTTKNISAPGKNIYSTAKGGTSSYVYMDGTSMAAPCVSGVAALVFASNPDLSAKNVFGILCGTARDLGPEGWDLEYGYGEVDAAAAVAAAGAIIDGDDSLLVGGSSTFKAPTGEEWAWASSDSSVATVSSEGVVTGRAGGTATITATRGPIKLSKSVTVYGASFVGPHAVAAGGSISLGFSESSGTGTWTFDSSNSSIAYSSTGTDGKVDVFGVAPGTCTITATLTTNPKVTFSHEIIVEKLSFEDDAMEITWPDFSGLVYTGSAIQPAPESVKWTFSNGEAMELSAGTGYALSYKGDNINVGTASVVVTGTKNYPGTVEKEFKILPAAVELPVAAEDLVYTGEEHTGVPAGDGYTLAGEVTAVNAGSHEVTATLADPANHVWADDGTTQPKTISWSIARRSVADAEVTGVTSQVLVEEGTPITLGDLAVSVDGKLLATDTDYSVSYSDNTKLGDATVTITGLGNYEGSIARSFHIGLIPIVAESVVVDGSSFTYRGEPIEPGVMVKLGDEILEKDVNYTVSYKDNVAAGEASVIVEGIGSCAGRAVVPFTIEPATVEPPVAAKGLVYTGTRQAGVLECEGYEFDGETSAISAGTYVATATLDDPVNYVWTEGSSEAKTISWAIAQAPISEAMVSGIPAYRYHTGNALQPEVRVRFGNKLLTRGLDYQVSYQGNTKIGTAKVTITGIGNFTGKVVEDFQIIAKPSCKGATSMPVKSKAAWTIAHCTLKVLAGSKGVVSIRGNVVTARKVGAAKIGVYNDAGVQVSTRTVRVYKLSGTTHTLRSAVNAKYAMDVRYASKNAKASVWLYRANGTKAQQFRFSLLSDGTYTMVNPNSGKAVSVEGASTADRANVVQLASRGKAHQRWLITVDSSNRLTFVNKRSGKALHLSGGMAENGRNIFQYAVKNTAAQKWILK